MKRNAYVRSAAAISIIFALAIQAGGIPDGSATPARLTIPQPSSAILSNGLEVFALENHRIPAFVLEMSVPASTFEQSQARSGVAIAVAELLFSGTRSRSGESIAGQLAELGATLEASLEFGGTVTRIRSSGPASSFPAVLALLSDSLLNATFPPDALNAWKSRGLAALNGARSSELFLAEEQVARVLYPGDPRSSVALDPASIEKLSRIQLAAFHRTHYHARGATVGVSGPIPFDTVMGLCRRALGQWQSGTVKPFRAPELPVLSRAVHIVPRTASTQALLLIANRAVRRNDPDYAACMVLNRLLGETPSSRLLRTLRDGMGLAYSAYSYFHTRGELQHFTAFTAVNPEKAGNAIDAMLEEFRKLREEPVSPQELRDAKRSIATSFALGFETQERVLQTLMTARAAGISKQALENYPDDVMRITPQDVQRVAQKYLGPRSLQIVAVGDAVQLNTYLSRFTGSAVAN